SNHIVPTANDDVAITCPVTVSGGNAQCRNLTVKNRLTIVGQTVGVSGNVVNYGTIVTQPSLTGSLQCNNLSNFRPQHAVSEEGIIDVNGQITVFGDVINDGMISGGGLVVASTGGGIHYLAGSGSWGTAGFQIGPTAGTIPQTASMASDLNIDAGYTNITAYGTLLQNGHTLT